MLGVTAPHREAAAWLGADPDLVQAGAAQLHTVPGAHHQGAVCRGQVPEV